MEPDYVCPIDGRLCHCVQLRQIPCEPIPIDHSDSLRIIIDQWLQIGRQGLADGVEPIEIVAMMYQSAEEMLQAVVLLSQADLLMASAGSETLN